MCRRVLWLTLVLSMAGLAIIKGYPRFFRDPEEVNSSVSARATGRIQHGITGWGNLEGYYFQNLTVKEQQIYSLLLQGVREESEFVDIPTTDGDSTAGIYEALLYDRPELFWCDGSSRMTIYEDFIRFYPGYQCTGAQKVKKEKEIEAAASECMNQMPRDLSEYEKIKYIFEYLIQTVDYVADAPDNQNIYSALVNRQSVCAGYSRAAQYLLNKIGIGCIYVVGDIAGQGAHAWNIVNCDGKDYQMDVTFGDPVFLAEESGKALPANIINYDYLCCTDQEIEKTHIPDERMEYPPCISEDLNYYRLTGMYYETFEKEKILQAMNESFYAGEDYFLCKFADEELYRQAHDIIIQELLPEAARNFADYYGLDRVEYTYAEDGKMNKITVFWSY